MSKFNTLESARGWIKNSPLSLAGFFGDDGLIWVVSGRKAQELDSQGYSRIY